jgi:hypothetical protein
VCLLPIDVGSVPHDAFSGSALIQKRDKRNGFISRPGVTRSTTTDFNRAACRPDLRVPVSGTSELIVDPVSAYRDSDAVIREATLRWH